MYFEAYRMNEFSDLITTCFLLMHQTPNGVLDQVEFLWTKVMIL